MNRSIKLSLPFVLALALAGCYAPPPPDPSAAAAAAEAELAAALAYAPESAAEPTHARAELERGVPHEAAMSEVVLDPRGEAALTLDQAGGVRLWPRLVADPSEAAPYGIPVHEPLWLSLAQASGGFTLGFIATNNAGTVYRVERAASGIATIVESFALSPEDPLLELHVLAGGTRILALGVDHRVRLYSVAGELLSVIDERGFGPWQLRVSGGEDGKPKLAAMLAQPLRVQPLRLTGDLLELAGPAREVVLDRGPNRNDLALSPDGKTVAALRRPGRNTKQWSVELIDLETDARSLIAGRIDTKVRPRMHYSTGPAGERLLLESGSGRAYMVDLSQAVALADPGHGDPSSKLAKRLAAELHHEFHELPASAERPWDLPKDDSGIRMHASVANGVRAAVDVRDDHRLVVGDPTGAEPLSFGHRPLNLTRVALDEGGQVVAWLSSAALHVEPVGGEGSPRELPYKSFTPLGVALTGPDRALVLSALTVAAIDLESGEVVASLDLENAPNSANPPAPDSATGYQALAGGAGQLAYLAGDWSGGSLRVIEFDGRADLRARAVAASEALGWFNLRGINRASTPALCAELGLACPGVSGLARAHTGRLMYIADSLHLFEVDEQPRDPAMGLRTTARTIPLPAGASVALTPSPVGARVAVVHDQAIGGLQVIMIDSETGEIEWAQGIGAGTAPQLSWSATGSQLAVLTSAGGWVYAANDGALVHQRSQWVLEVRRPSETAL